MLKTLTLSLVVLLVLAACGKAPTETNQTIATPAAQHSDNSHNSANALDWTGVYKGVVPCADCEGIETSLTLNMDQTYTLRTLYLGKDASAFLQQGQFDWDPAGSVIRLSGQKEGPNQYKVQENQLLQLDMSGQVISGDLAGHYRLHKQAESVDYQLTGVRWQLTELMGQAIPLTEPDMTPYLEFGEDNRVSGFAGCNQFSGAYETQGLRLSFKPLAATQKACLNGAVEQQFLHAIQSIDNYTVNEHGLAFSKARTAALVRFSAVTP